MMCKKSEFISQLGRKIARIRKMRGLSQFEFADQSGKIVNTISKIERGIGTPRLSTLLDIAEALDISLLELLNIKLDELQKSGSKMSEMERMELMVRFNNCDEITLKLFSDLLNAFIRQIFS